MLVETLQASNLVMVSFLTVTGYGLIAGPWEKYGTPQFNCKHLAQSFFMCHSSAMTYDEVLEHYGTVIRASQKLGITHQAIYAWKKAGYIPRRAQKHIQAETRGKLKINRGAA